MYLVMERMQGRCVHRTWLCGGILSGLTLHEVCNGSANQLPHLLSTLPAKLRMLHHVSLGVLHLHDLGVVHRDIALRNVVLRGGSEVHAMVADLG